MQTQTTMLGLALKEAFRERWYPPLILACVAQLNYLDSELTGKLILPRDKHLTIIKNETWRYYLHVLFKSFLECSAMPQYCFSPQLIPAYPETT